MADGGLIILGLTLISAIIYLFYPHKLYDEDYRPQFHYSPVKNWMNDPNGLFQDTTGLFHMFYQYNPDSTRDSNLSWGHATSSDMAHWLDKGTAISYTPEYMIFSGSQVIDFNNTSGFAKTDSTVRPYVAIYTRAEPNRQSQSLAYSLDGGVTYMEYEGNPVLDKNLANFRDPKVMWYEPDSVWVMTVAVSSEFKVEFYTSHNLKDWTYTGEYQNSNWGEYEWECPGLMSFDDNWVLIVNQNPISSNQGSGARYAVGDFNGATFSSSGVEGIVDHGRDFYAFTTWFEYDLKANSAYTRGIAWMSNWNYAKELPMKDWIGQQTSPRRYYLDDQRNLRQMYETAEFLDKISTHNTFFLSNASIEYANSSLEQFTSGICELQHIIVHFEQLDIGESWGVSVRVGNNQQTKIAISRFQSYYEIEFDRSNSSNFDWSALGADKNTLQISSTELYFDILVDRSSVEIIFDHGLHAFTYLIFPDRKSTGIVLFGNSPNSIVEEIKVTELSKSMPDSI